MHFFLRRVVTVTREPFEWDIWLEVAFLAPARGLTKMKGQ